ncbi:hypothetical protein HPB50_004192 [Hyalomma asiaticum]|uniref:Uncharacterized protein n=1 Tax=Hyalomma asiaticum TaxID=266040 RepID=A0ACB7SUZ1_HYAAI|nr:hypothetical protein HPB50_004192 [Hyalomma asiaticum]
MHSPDVVAPLPKLPSQSPRHGPQGTRRRRLYGGADEDTPGTAYTQPRHTTPLHGASRKNLTQMAWTTSPPPTTTTDRPSERANATVRDGRGAEQACASM